MAPSSDLAHIQEVKLQRYQGAQASMYFGAVIGGLIFVFAAAHWSTRLLHRPQIRNTSIVRTITTWLVPLRKHLYGRKIYGIEVLPERVALAIVYFGANIGVSIWGIDWQHMNHITIFANRLGWVALCNMMLAIFLGLKNTPLSPIAGRSYESLNVLHRWCGYTTILITVIHTAVYAAGLHATKYAHLMTTPGTIGADVAGIAMILILLTANGYVRRRYFEIFYLLHIILIVITLITVCFHTSKAGRNALYMALIATGMYTLNRVLRWTRILYYIPSNTAILTPLHASNATRVTLSRSMKHAAPGSHAFLYIPSIAALQSHPFTMVNREPIEFVVSARAGFTKALFDAACEKPGRRVRAGVEGAYGCVPDVSRYDTVVLMAGGSGATFAFALAVEWARRNDAESKGRLVFVWSLRTAAHLAGFVPELATLENHPRIEVRVHVTQPSSKISGSPSLETEKSPDVSQVTARPLTPSPTTTPETEKSEFEVKGALLPPYVECGRPDFHAVISRVADDSTIENRVLVAACGPGGLVDGVRDAVKENTKKNGPGIELHVEAFG